MNALLSFFSMSSVPGEPACHFLLDAIRRKFLARKEILFRAGELCDQFCFLEDGLLRRYIVRGKKETNIDFLQCGDCCTITESFHLRKPSRHTVQALEDSLVYYINYAELLILFRDFPALDTSARLWLQREQIRSEQKKEFMWMQKPAERYRWFLEHQPELRRRVADKQLASHLGISTVLMSQLTHQYSRFTK